MTNIFHYQKNRKKVVIVSTEDAHDIFRFRVRQQHLGGICQWYYIGLICCFGSYWQSTYLVI